MDPKISSIANRIASGTGGTIRTAGRVEFVKDTGPIRRDVRVEGFKWAPESLRNLAKILWATQRSHSYAVSALRLFSKMPSSQFSPDGLLGGRGYIQAIKDMRSALGSSVETLSNFTDTLYDEINAGHWSPAETEESDGLVENAEQVKGNPEKFVEQAYREEGEEDFMGQAPGDMNPSPEDFGQHEEEKSEEEEAGEVDAEATQRQATSILSTRKEIDSRDFGGYSAVMDKVLGSRIHTAGGSSSLPVETLPGPRINHVGPGMNGENIFTNPEDDFPSDVDSFYTTENPYTNGYEDGSSPYDNPTRGDGANIKKASETYSLLPGSNNQKIMPWYTRGLSEDDIKWMIANSDPKVSGVREKPKKPNTAHLWKKK